MRALSTPLGYLANGKGCLDIRTECFDIENLCLDIDAGCFEIKNACFDIGKLSMWKQPLSMSRQT